MQLTESQLVVTSGGGGGQERERVAGEAKVKMGEEERVRGG